MVLVGDIWVAVIGILEPVELVPDVDRTVIVGCGFAEQAWEAERNPSEVFVRAHPDSIDRIRAVLARTANPLAAHEISVSRPSDALAARAAVDTGFTALLVGLGGVALLVGGVGIANVMVIAVLERWQEIGIRRALGAARRHIRRQFLLEAVLLSVLGGVIGAFLGATATLLYAEVRGWRVDLPLVAPIGGIAAAIVVGAIAGSYPAQRAAMLAPVDAIRAT